MECNTHGTPVIYLTVILLFLISLTYHTNREFDRQRWMAEIEKRYELSEDIIESKILIGKTKAEVRLILDDEDNNDDSDLWTYYLGFRPSFAGIDPDVLDIEFENGKLTRVTQRET